MEQEEMDKCIWDFIDKSGDGAYLRGIEQKINSDHNWAARYEDLNALSTQLTRLPVEQPSLRFTQNIMDALADVPQPVSAQSYINMRIVKCIAAVFLCIIAGALCYFIAVTNWSPNDLPVTSRTVAAPISVTAFIQGIVAINILLGLLFFEKISARLLRHQGL